MHVCEPVLKKVIFISLFFFALLFYLKDLCPTISWRDAPEFVTVSYNLDISHPAGSPTYSLSSKIFTLIPIGNIALRINFFSSVMSSICIALIFILLCEISSSNVLWKKLVSSLCGSLSLVISKAFWSFSEIAEVYTFQALLIVIILFLTLKSQSSKLDLNLRCTYGFSFLYGLSLGVHASIAIFSPVFIFYIFAGDKAILRTRYLAFMLFFAALGFATYAYLPLRSISLLAFDWGDPETFRQFLVQILDQKGAKNVNYRLINLSISMFKIYIDHLVNEFSILLCLIGILGFMKLLLFNLRCFVLLFSIFISNIIFFLNAGWTVSWGYIPSFLIFSIFIGHGVDAVINFKCLFIEKRINFSMPKQTPLVVGISIVIYIVVVINREENLNFNNDYSAKLVGQKVLSRLPPDAILFSDYMWFPLTYLQQIERRRPDLTFILQGEILFPEYFEDISKKRFPNIKHVEFLDRFRGRGPAYNYFWELAKANAFDHSLFWEPDGQIQELISEYIIPYGLLFLFDPYNKKEIRNYEIDRDNMYLNEWMNDVKESVHNFEGRYYITNKLNFIANFWSKLQNENRTINIYNTAINMLPQGERINSNYGAYLISKGKLLDAVRYLEKSYETSKYNIPVYKNFSNIMIRTSNYSMSLHFLNDAEKIMKDQDEDIFLLFGVSYAELKAYEYAISFLEKSKNIMKSKSSIESYGTKYTKQLKRIKLYKELCFEGIMGDQAL